MCPNWGDHEDRRETQGLGTLIYFGMNGFIATNVFFFIWHREVYLNPSGRSTSQMMLPTVYYHTKLNCKTVVSSNNKTQLLCIHMLPKSSILSTSTLRLLDQVLTSIGKHAIENWYLHSWQFNKGRMANLVQFID